MKARTFNFVYICNVKSKIEMSLNPKAGKNNANNVYQSMLPYGRTAGILPFSLKGKNKRVLVFFKKHLPVVSRLFYQFILKPKSSVRIVKKNEVLKQTPIH